MLINEIFKSISGESVNAGYPTIFIRTFGCNLKCTYCDSLYAVEGNDYKQMTPNEILQECEKLGVKRIIFTGGEPLVQKDAPQLVDLLCDNGYFVEIETNGAVNLQKFHDKLQTKRKDNLMYTMDYKTFSSGALEKMIKSNLEFLGTCDVIKFVVGSTEDLELMENVLNNNDIKAIPFVSPIFGDIEPKEIVKYLLDKNLTQCRFQLQIHKFVWDVNKRGV